MQSCSASAEWWDRELDNEGREIRKDVREAAHAVWDKAYRRTIAVLGDHTEAAELMESTVMRVSDFLERRTGPGATDNLAGLVLVSFCRELNRVASKLRRLEPVGSALDLERNSGTCNQWDEIGQEIDKSKILAQLTPGNRQIWSLRDQGYDWSEIAEHMGTSPASAKSSYWRQLRKTLRDLQIESPDQSETRNHLVGN